MRRAALVAGLVLLTACRGGEPDAVARHLVVITIDTLRADSVGAYGATAARTPALDGLARDGVRFEHAWATAPITLPSHASLFTGRYPPAHGARHNGMMLNTAIPTLAETLSAAGFDTAAFVSAFPLDKRFGLARGFALYDDQLPRTDQGLVLNERPGSATVDRALAWLRSRGESRLFLWVHLFEPHAPYGNSSAGGSLAERYASEVTAADAEVGRLLAGLGDRAAETLVIAAADHGEAFGEHGEQGHSIFVYDTTLRVPLLLRGPGVPRGVVAPDEVSLADVVPTVTALLGLPPGPVGEGISLIPAIKGDRLPRRALYAESFAPFFDFGWAGLRSVRDDGWKYIEAPRPELFELGLDPEESANMVESRPDDAARLEAVVARWGSSTPAPAAPPPDVAARLGSLGYISQPASRGPGSARPDPKDRIAVASQLARVTSNEVEGQARIDVLESVLAADPGNPQAHLRLGFAETERNRCDLAVPHFRAALAAGLPSADAGLGLAECLGRVNDLAGAEAALTSALASEPGNPVVTANLGMLTLERGDLAGAVAHLRAAVTLDPELLPARFALARALARSGDRAGALAEARDLLARLSPSAPQRPEVERLITALQ